MGYTISIGEAELFREEFEIVVCVKEEKHDNAPADGVPTDFTNSRWPSYSQWSEFTEIVGLKDLFFNQYVGLMREHPFACPINKKHKEEIDKSFIWLEKKIKFSELNKEAIENLENQMRRLNWLKYWVDWSLENCVNPIIKNS